LATAFGFLENDDGTSSTTLSPTSSDLRCSHFWDAMQFVDQMTQISLDLRRVPIIYRQVSERSGPRKELPLNFFFITM
jgi:hypothetical protein